MAEKRAKRNDSNAVNFSNRSGFSKGGSGRYHFKKPYDRNQSSRVDTMQNSEERSVNRGPSEGQRCYKCDKLGHIARYCRSDPSAIRCFSCGEIGRAHV